MPLTLALTEHWLQQQHSQLPPACVPQQAQLLLMLVLLEVQLTLLYLLPLLLCPLSLLGCSLVEPCWPLAGPCQVAVLSWQHPYCRLQLQLEVLSLLQLLAPVQVLTSALQVQQVWHHCPALLLVQGQAWMAWLVLQRLQVEVHQTLRWLMRRLSLLQV
jgi:hypothetical protein